MRGNYRSFEQAVMAKRLSEPWVNVRERRESARAELTPSELLRAENSRIPVTQALWLEEEADEYAL